MHVRIYLRESCTSQIKFLVAIPDRFQLLSNVMASLRGLHSKKKKTMLEIQ